MRGLSRGFPTLRLNAFARIAFAGSVVEAAHILVAQDMAFHDIAAESALGHIPDVVDIRPRIIFIHDPFLHQLAFVFLDGGDVVGDIEADGIAEVLADAVPPFDSELQAFVLHGGEILVGSGDSSHRHVNRGAEEDAGGIADVSVDFAGEAVSEESEIDSDISRPGCFWA